MPGWTHPTDTRSDPRKSVYYVYYRCQPFLPKKSELLETLPRGRFKAGILRNILEEEINLVEDAQEIGSKNWRLIAPQEKIRRYHELLAENLYKIKSRRIWWFTGESPNQSSGRIRKIGHDPVSQDFELSNIFANVIADLDKEHQKQHHKPLDAYKEDLAMFMTDFITFVEIPELYPEPKTSYCFQELFKQVNEEMEKKHKSGFGSLEKLVTEKPLIQQPSADYHSSIHSPGLAKRLLLHDGITGEGRHKQSRDIDEYGYITDFLLGAVYTSPAGIWSRLGLNEINIHTIKSSEIFQAVISSPYAGNFKVTESELMRSDEAKKSRLREISHCAIQVLMNNLRSAWFPKPKQIVQIRI